VFWFPQIVQKRMLGEVKKWMVVWWLVVSGVFVPKVIENLIIHLQVTIDKFWCVFMSHSVLAVPLPDCVKDLQYYNYRFYRIPWMPLFPRLFCCSVIALCVLLINCLSQSFNEKLQAAKTTSVKPVSEKRKKEQFKRLVQDVIGVSSTLLSITNSGVI